MPKDFLKWKLEKRNGIYRKMLIFNLLFLKIYMLNFTNGTFVEKHIEKLEGKKQYRINIVLRGANSGGRMFVDNKPILDRIFMFRPDEKEFKINRIMYGSIIMVAIGITLKDKNA